MPRITHKGLGALTFLLFLPAPVAIASEPPCSDDLFLTNKIACYRDAALASGNPMVCLGTEEAVEFNCIALYAEKSGDADACALLPGEGTEVVQLRNACISGVAIATETPAMCERIELPVLHDTCYAQLVLERGADPVLCDNIETDALREACRAP